MKPRLRCAIYTRKSSEEGLDQHFNSLHAQREACEAYVRSQAGEGWSVLKATYDDGGFSGGSMDRPALARLLADIGAGRIDVVVVYKVDRLTRSLADFAKIVEAFDARGVSFVSVTQAFNTTSSMGRLTLNVLLSFAQFEREVTGERIRDKIAASKAKGMWMGGTIPLGYSAPTDPVTRALVVNAAEAATVRRVFELYLEIDSVHRLRERLRAEGVRTAVRIARRGTMRGGQPFGRGGLFHLLRNRIYLGEIPHAGRTFPGAHPALVDPETFEAVQRQLDAHVRRSASEGRTQAMALTGRLFNAAGEPLSPTSTRGSKGQVYRYYVAASLQRGEKRSRGGVRRVPAAALEACVAETLQKLVDTADLDRLIRAEVQSGGLVLVVRAPGLESDLPPGWSVRTAQDETLQITRPVQWVRRRGRAEVLPPPGQGGAPGPRPDPYMVKALRRAHQMLAQHGGCPVGRPEQALPGSAPDGPYERRLIRLAFLAPDLQAKILEGRQPRGLTLKALLRWEPPADWPAQRAEFEALG
ncbi:MAG: recombinase family protein [Phenylobacterium sp.]|jgi:site-specific DNA recombinase|uniref:recombinase family protein n=1 Tax=Phenylobacterium sp. TaxID=1871053 RepID=UPI00391EEEF4